MSDAMDRTRRGSVKTTTNKSRDGEDSDSDFEFDLSGSAKDDPQDGPNKFMLLCDSVHSSLALLNIALEEFYQLKDELMKHKLPLKVLTMIGMVSARIQRYHSDLYVPVTSLTRMVRVHSRPWDEKSTTLKKIKKDQESKQRQLDIALKKIEMFSLEEERIRTERRIMNWEKLYAKLFNSKSQGYRWKFLIESFKAKIDKGLAAFNPYMSDSDEDSDDDTTTAQLQIATESSEDELKDLPSDSEGEFATDKSSSLHGRRTTSSSLRNKSSARSSSRSKRVRFADENLLDSDQSSTHLPKSPYPVATPPVESHDAATWTHEPTYNCHLVLCAYRPNSLEPGKNLHEEAPKLQVNTLQASVYDPVPAEKELCCTFSLGSNFLSSKKFPKLRKKSSLFENYQQFWFQLSKAEAEQISAVLSLMSTGHVCGREAGSEPAESKLGIAVYANNISTNIIAMASVPLKRLTISTEAYKVKPPVDRSVKFTLEKAKILSQLMIDDGTVTPTPYRLIGTDEEDAGAIPMCCHLVMVEELMQSEISTDTMPLEGLLEEMGYRKINQAYSRATSPMKPFDEEPESIEKEDAGNLSQEQYAALSLQHAEELRELQEQYENKIETLTKTLAQMKKERTQHDGRLTVQEQEPQELHKAKPGTKSPEHRTVITRKKLVQPQKGLPAWGSSFPEDFFERMELFAQESVQKHDTLVKRIRKEVSNTCEKQMASQHKLAQSVRTNYSNIMEDVSLPAILMPTKLGHVYSPRAHCYFHPTGTSEPRVTQAPAVFKLPILKNKDKLTTLNLFDINELFCSSSGDPTWMKTADQSPMFTPAPPPSACGFNINPSSSPPLVKKVK